MYVHRRKLHYIICGQTLYGDFMYEKKKCQWVKEIVSQDWDRKSCETIPLSILRKKRQNNQEAEWKWQRRKKCQREEDEGEKVVMKNKESEKAEEGKVIKRSMVNNVGKRCIKDG